MKKFLEKIFINKWFVPAIIMFCVGINLYLDFYGYIVVVGWFALTMLILAILIFIIFFLVQKFNPIQKINQLTSTYTSYNIKVHRWLLLCCILTIIGMLVLIKVTNRNNVVEFIGSCFMLLSILVLYFSSSAIINYFNLKKTIKK